VHDRRGLEHCTVTRWLEIRAHESITGCRVEPSDDLAAEQAQLRADQERLVAVALRLEARLRALAY